MATPEVAGRLLFEALAEARLASLPEAHEDLRAFAEAELTQVVSDTLGPDAVAPVRERIDLVLRVLAQIERQPNPPERSERVPRMVVKTPVATAAAQRDTRRPPRIHAERGDATLELPPMERSSPRISTDWVPGGSLASSSGRVVLVTTDARLGSELRVRLGSGATVLTYRTPAELARSPVGLAKVLVLDMRDLPRDFEFTRPASGVLLWPATKEQREKFAAKHPALKEIESAGEEANVEDLAAVILLRL